MNIFSSGSVPQLFNEGNSPYNDVGDIDIKRRVKQGCHLPHTMTIPDDIWAIAERCWDMSAKRRPSMRVLVDELTEAQKRSRGFLTSVLTSLASIPSNNADRQGVLEEVLLLARNRNLREILEFKDSNAQHAFDILHEVCRISLSWYVTVRSPYVDSPRLLLGAIQPSNGYPEYPSHLVGRARLCCRHCPACLFCVWSRDYPPV